MTRLILCLLVTSRSKGVDPENPKCVVVAVFFKDRCHLLEAWNFEGLHRGAGSAGLCKRSVFGLTACEEAFMLFAKGYSNSLQGHISQIKFFQPNLVS